MMSLDLHGLKQIGKLWLSFGLFIATPLGLNDLIFISGFFFPLMSGFVGAFLMGDYYTFHRDVFLDW